MIKKKFFEFNKDWNRYTIFGNIPTFGSELGFVATALNPSGADEVLRVYVVEPSINNTVFIYSENSFKDQADLEFETVKEEDAFEDAYLAYRNKREDDMPYVELSIFDWKELKQKWNQIIQQKSQYVMFVLDDSGSLDKIDIIGKDELSQEDLDYIQQEHEKYLKYQRARQKYIENHLDYSEVWRGPQDDEYEADIMKYYED